MKQLKNQRGLTLVELLAVIVILAIIAAIAAVAIGNVINNSKDKAALSDAVMILEGAKLANLDGACEDKDGSITCTADHLKGFVSADLEQYYTGDKLPDTIAKFTAAGKNGGEWSIAATKQMAEIRNSKYYPGNTKPAEKADITEGAIKGALKGDDKKVTP